MKTKEIKLPHDGLCCTLFQWIVCIEQWKI